MKTKIPIEYILVDGGSTIENQNKIIDIFRSELPFRKRKLILSDRKITAGECYNIGYDTARGKYVFFTNDDVEIMTDGYAEKMIKIVEQDSNIGIVGAAGDIVYHYQRSNIKKVINNIGKIKEIPQLSGVLIMTPREWWDKIGYYDENLAPNAGNDADYSVRAKAHGAKIVMCEDVYVRHHKLQDRNSWRAAYKYNCRKYGVNYITDSNYGRCVRKAKEIYGIK